MHISAKAISRGEDQLYLVASTVGRELQCYVIPLSAVRLGANEVRNRAAAVFTNYVMSHPSFVEFNTSNNFALIHAPDRVTNMWSYSLWDLQPTNAKESVRIASKTMSSIKLTVGVCCLQLPRPESCSAGF
jgi:hypothetical protein